MTRCYVGTKISAWRRGNGQIYIHKIKSGDQKQYVKYLLRLGKREAIHPRLTFDGWQKVSHVKNKTVLNLSFWSSEQREKLEQALQLKRRCKNTYLEKEADIQIVDIVFEHEVKRGVNPYPSAAPLMNALDVPLDERWRWDTVPLKFEVVTTTTYTYKN